MEKLIDQVKFNEKGLVPAIAQDVDTKAVLMMAWMNRESLKRTIKEGYACYWSRSRQKFWVKGETSGHLQKIQKILVDCDLDTILLLVKQKGAACHTGKYTCFYRDIDGNEVPQAK
jgi:phosphoribosyl-AMP cyclohydrolase